ncbi:MAG TPA: bifunctional riboflavin kinase/FAD synthetase [Cellvibrionaceae bacterium]
MSRTPEFIRGLHNLRPRHRGSVATIGTFDGIHRGHQAILQQLRTAAEQHQLPAVVIIFEPQPHEYFARETAPARLMSLAEKSRALFAAGVDRVLCLSFNHALAGLTAEQFVQKVLIEGLGIRHLVVGDDFRFGCDRQGNFALLQSLGAKQGFTVSDTATLTDAGVRISSTRIRQLLQQADFASAEKLLGRPYSIAGRVEHGKKLGRTLGIPTANIQMRRYRAPLAGVYVVVAALGDKCWPAVANVGVRPSVDSITRPLLEVHLLDYAGNLYGKRLSVFFKAKLRDEQRFDSIEALRTQLQQDIEQARAYFARAHNIHSNHAT